MSRGGWRQHLLMKAASAGARYVLDNGRRRCGYEGSDLHFAFAFTTEEAAHKWNYTMRPRKRPLGGDDAITVRVSGCPLADVEIGPFVGPDDYSPTDTRSANNAWGLPVGRGAPDPTHACSPENAWGSWGSVCSDAHTEATLLSTSDNEAVKYQCFVAPCLKLRRAHLIDKAVATPNKLDDINNHLGLPSCMHELFDRLGGSSRHPPELVVCLAETNPMGPLPTEYGMESEWDQSALVRAAKKATPPKVDPATVPSEPGHDQWVCGTGTSEHVRHRVFLDCWFVRPDSLGVMRSIFDKAKVLMATQLGLLRTYVYVRNPAKFKLCLAWKLADTLSAWALCGVNAPAGFARWNLSEQQLRNEYGAVGWSHTE